MTSFLPPACQAHAIEVRVKYDGFHNDIHWFSVSSLSSSHTWTVQVQLSHKFNVTSGLSPEALLQQGFVKLWSDDPFFTFGGCAYNLTLQGSCLYPFFRAPRFPSHDYGCSHTAFAVLQLLSHLGPGVLEESFSKVLRWTGSSFV